MKRHGWLALGCALSFWASACGDGTAGSDSGDLPGSDSAMTSADAGTDASIDASTGTDSAIPLTGPCAPGAPVPPTDETRTLMEGGLARTFNVHVPPGYDGSATPLVVNFHGFMSNADQQAWFSDMTPKADAEGFLLVYPQGSGLIPSWNGGACCGTAVDDNVDDVAFLSAMLDDLEANLCVDPQRIYVTGMSNGGFLSNRIGCELSDRIAAVAPVAGVLGIPTCTPTRPMPIMHFHGTLDPLVPWGGSTVLGFISVNESITGWALRNGCDATPVNSFTNGDSHCETYPNCNAGVETTLCTVEGGGHTWPGGADILILGHTTTDLIANDEMWDFFVAHPLP